MKFEKRLTKRHLFICTNKKAEGASCGAKDSEELVQKIKLKLRENGLWDHFKVTKSGCLGPCAEGISAIIFPENELITKISLDDFEELYQKLIS